MDMRDWAVKTWRCLSERRFAYNTKRYGKPYLTGLTQGELEIVIDALVDTLIEELASDGDLRIAKLGHFKVSEKASRQIVSNLDRAHYDAPARRIVIFKPSSALQARMNRHGNE